MRGPSGEDEASEDARVTGTNAKLYVPLDDRGVLAVGGADARDFLQGLISNDMERVAPGRAIYAALLNPKGRFLFDFFVVEHEGAFLLDCEAPRLADLARRLSLYRLRAKVEIAEASDRFSVAALIGADAAAALDLPAEPGRARAAAGGLVYVDPRGAALGARALVAPEGAATALADAGFSPGTWDDYDRLRLSLGVPDGSRDLVVDEALLMESGFETLHGLDWDKGCYIGQEVTARMRYRALVKKRLLPVAVEGPLPAPGTPVTLEGRRVGEVRSGRDGRALALIKVAALEGADKAGAGLVAGEATLRVEGEREGTAAQVSG